MQPLNPHTSTLEARECEECHQNPQTMGFGMRYGEYDATPWGQFIWTQKIVMESL